MEWLTDPQAWIALATLTALEVVLGIDNIIFISILVGRLPEQTRNRARVLGLGLAMGARLVLLFSLTWIMGLTEPFFSVFGMGVSGRDIILIGGGLFLLWKSVHEIHKSLEGEEAHETAGAPATFGATLVQIALIDVVFSFDSVITAVGLVDEIGVMVVAIIVAVLLMMVAARPIGEFVETHPTIKMLALSFLILVGFALMAEGFELHIPKGYIYFAMAFSVSVEMLNLRVRARAARRRGVAGTPVRLRKSLSETRKTAAERQSG